MYIAGTMHVAGTSGHVRSHAGSVVVAAGGTPVVAMLRRPYRSRRTMVAFGPYARTGSVGAIVTSLISGTEALVAVVLVVGGAHPLVAVMLVADRPHIVVPVVVPSGSGSVSVVVTVVMAVSVGTGMCGLRGAVAASF